LALNISLPSSRWVSPLSILNIINLISTVLSTLPYQSRKNPLSSPRGPNLVLGKSIYSGHPATSPAVNTYGFFPTIPARTEISSVSI